MTAPNVARKPTGCLAALMLLIVTIIPTSVVLLSRPSELTARTIGGFFQLLGIAAVAYGIWELRIVFKVPKWRDDLRKELAPLWSNAKYNVKRWLGIRRKVNAITGMGGTAIGGAVALGGSLEVRPPLTLEWLAQEVDNTKAAIRELKREIPRQKQELQDSITAEAAKREEMHAELNGVIAALAVGGLRVETIGIVWLLLGTVLTTWPSAIARLFGASG